MVQIFGEAFHTIFLEVELHQSHLRKLTYLVFLNQRGWLVAHRGLDHELSSLIFGFPFYWVGLVIELGFCGEMGLLEETLIGLLTLWASW